MIHTRVGLRARGVSLLEVLIAMFVLSIGATSVLALFAAAASTHKRSIDRTHAALLAERILAEVEARYEPGADPEAIRTELAEALPPQFEGYGWEVFLYPLEGAPRPPAGRRSERRRAGAGTEASEELLVRIAIRWQQKAHARAETYDAIILARPSPPGRQEPAGERVPGRFGRWRR